MMFVIGRWRFVRLGRDRRGATALEFALIAAGGILPTFFFIFNVGIQLFTQATLEQATFAAARQIRIGSSNGASASALRSYMCSQLVAAPLDCSAIQIYAASGPSFAALQQATVGSDGTLTPSTYNPGVPQDSTTPLNMTLLQVAYKAKAPLPMPMFISTFMSVAVFRNEPYHAS